MLYVKEKKWIKQLYLKFWICNLSLNLPIVPFEGTEMIFVIEK